MDQQAQQQQAQQQGRPLDGPAIREIAQSSHQAAQALPTHLQHTPPGQAPQHSLFGAVGGLWGVLPPDIRQEIQGYGEDVLKRVVDLGQQGFQVATAIILSQAGRLGLDLLGRGNAPMPQGQGQGPGAQTGPLQKVGEARDGGAQIASGQTRIAAAEQAQKSSDAKD